MRKHPSPAERRSSCAVMTSPGTAGPGGGSRAVRVLSVEGGSDLSAKQQRNQCMSVRGAGSQAVTVLSAEGSPPFSETTGSHRMSVKQVYTSGQSLAKLPTTNSKASAAPSAEEARRRRKKVVASHVYIVWFTLMQFSSGQSLYQPTNEKSPDFYVTSYFHIVSTAPPPPPPLSLSNFGESPVSSQLLKGPKTKWRSPLTTQNLVLLHLTFMN